MADTSPIRIPVPAADIPASGTQFLAQMLQLERRLFPSGSTGQTRMVAFCGAAPRVGNSFVVSALARVAVANGRSVGIVDLAELAELAHRSASAGGSVGNSAPMTMMMDLLRERVEGTRLDMVLIDAPSVTEGPEMLGLLRQGMEVVLVVEAERTRARSVRAALDMIEMCGGKCLGLVLNKRRRRWLWAVR